MSPTATPEFNQDPDFQAAVDALVERHGIEGAEGRLCAALSEVRKRKAESKRRGG